MKQTTERHDPDAVHTAEGRVADAMHRFAYSVVEDYAHGSERLLEIGFGEGYGAEMIKPWVSEYCGVEVDPDAVSHARGRYGDVGSTFTAYDGDALPFEDGGFDLIVSYQVIEHVDDPDAFLREARRVARDGAVVLITTPNRTHRLADGERPWNRYHLREYTPAELESILRTVFDEVEIFGVFGSPPMNDIERRRIARARKLARLDPLGLRYVLPESLDLKIRKAFRRTSAAPGEDAAFGPSDVRRSRECVEEALDLLGVARV